MRRNYKILMLLLTFLTFTNLKADVKESIQINPLFMRINKIESGKKFDSFQVYGTEIQLTASPLTDSNYCLKGKYNRCWGRKVGYEGIAFNVGYKLPIDEKFYAVPYIGFSNYVLKEKNFVNSYKILPDTLFKTKFITFDFGTEMGFIISEDLIARIDVSFAAGRKIDSFIAPVELRELVDPKTKYAIGKSDIAFSLDYIYSDKINLNAKIGANAFLNRKKFGFATMYTTFGAEYKI